MTTILLAEDEPVTRRTLTAVLVQKGFTVHSVADGEEGRALLDKLGADSPTLLITDVDMPGCGGEDLMSHARRHFGGIKVLFTSGTPRPSVVQAIAGDHGAAFLQKPFGYVDLFTAIKKLGVDSVESN